MHNKDDVFAGSGRGRGNMPLAWLQVRALEAFATDRADTHDTVAGALAGLQCGQTRFKSAHVHSS